RQFVLETDGVHDETTADFFNGIGQKRSYGPLTPASSPLRERTSRAPTEKIREATSRIGLSAGPSQRS
ncbi:MULTISPECIES: hypothetical protein, partial [unclassified Bradyrhizobium]|uniref:hypothetical protein n=1 Tax=unclassified Bradyrhizobium TaxID=2631580 RepID=UPI0028E668A2